MHIYKYELKYKILKTHCITTLRNLWEICLYHILPGNWDSCTVIRKEILRLTVMRFIIELHEFQISKK